MALLGCGIEEGSLMLIAAEGEALGMGGVTGWGLSRFGFGGWVNKTHPKLRQIQTVELI